MDKETDIFIDRILRDFNNIEAPAEGKRLGVEKALMFYNLYRELSDWNKKINLTSISGIDDFIQKHILDSAFLLKILDPKSSSIIDIGSGAGFPGLVAAILNPSLKVFSVESILKKCNFQKHAARKIGLKNFECFNCNIFSCGNINIKSTAFTTRAAFNPKELVNFIEKFDFGGEIAYLYAFMSHYRDAVTVGNYKYGLKRVGLDSALFYRTSNPVFKDKNFISTGNPDEFRIIGKFGVETAVKPFRRRN